VTQCVLIYLFAQGFAPREEGRGCGFLLRQRHRTGHSRTTQVCHTPTLVLEWCYSGVGVVLQWCYSGVTVVLEWCYSGVTVVLQWWYVNDFVLTILELLKYATRPYYTVVTLLLHCCYICTHTCSHAHTQTHTCTYTHQNTRVHKYTHTHTHTCTHTHIHTHTHTHTVLNQA
jgi:hypothetical protein